MINFIVDENLCIQCGSCSDDCPVSIILMDGYPTIKNEEPCIHCQHCLAICPEGAISILGKKAENSTLIEGNLPTINQMATLIKGRRSVRNYKDQNVDSAVIQDLIDIAWHAPTGRNAQQIKVTVLNNKEMVNNLRDEIYEQLPLVLSENRETNAWIMKYLRWALKMWTKRGEDPIFLGAPHVVIASAPKNDTTAMVDTHIFLSYFELMAQTMGLGTLWNGILYSTLQHALPDLQQKLGISQEYKIGYTMLFGLPNIKYARTVQRDLKNVRYIQ
jgi:nitroreductase/NAD-dependent dihydropyrimidine dehydrogenase PreA subunit